MSFKICVAGAAAGGCLIISSKKAEALGRAIAKQKAVLLTGATTGIPHSVAKGAKQAGGFCIGFSPAASPREHKKVYRLPTDFLDLIIYTGFGYAGRNLLLTRASDAVIIICGRIGSLNEFTIAFEDRKIIGILSESGGIADQIPKILATAKRELKNTIIYDSDPKRLVQKIIQTLRKKWRNNSYYL